MRSLLPFLLISAIALTATASLGATDAEAIGVRARVVDSDGSPIAGAIAELRQIDSRYRAAQRLFEGEAYGDLGARARASADGVIELEAPSPGMWQLVVTAANRGAGSAEAKLVKGQRYVELRLDAAVSVRGRVVDPQGQPLAGRQITVMPLVELTYSTSTKSQADGSWGFGSLEPSRYRLEERRSGLLRFTSSQAAILGVDEFEVADRPIDDLIMVVDPGRRLIVRVIGAEPWELADMEVRVGDVESTTGSADGVFELTGLGPGDQRLKVRVGSTDRSVEMPVVIPPTGSAVETDVAWQGDFTVAGRVTFSGEIRPETVGLRLRSTDERGAGHSATVTSSGRFRFERVHGGAYELVVSLDGLASSLARRQLSVDSDLDLSLDLSPSTLLGTVRSRHDQLPVAGATVQLAPLDDQAADCPSQTRTRTDGTFRAIRPAGGEAPNPLRCQRLAWFASSRQLSGHRMRSSSCSAVAKDRGCAGS